MADDEEVNSVPFQDVLRVYRIPIILGCLSLLFLCISITIFIKSYQSTQPITFSSDSQHTSVKGIATASADTKDIAVDVEGAVLRPGVYHLAQGSRVDDAIKISGGLTSRADENAVSLSLNRAAILADGAKIYVPVQGESGSSVGVLSVGSSSQGVVHINSSSLSELDILSGVGPVTAANIIAGRPYMRTEELVEKKVMTASLFAKLKNQLTL